MFLRLCNASAPTSVRGLSVDNVFFWPFSSDTFVLLNQTYNRYVRGQRWPKFKVLQSDFGHLHEKLRFFGHLFCPNICSMAAIVFPCRLSDVEILKIVNFWQFFCIPPVEKKYICASALTIFLRKLVLQSYKMSYSPTTVLHRKTS